MLRLAEKRTLSKKARPLKKGAPFSFLQPFFNSETEVPMASLDGGAHVVSPSLPLHTTPLTARGRPSAASRNMELFPRNAFDSGDLVDASYEYMASGSDSKAVRSPCPHPDTVPGTFELSEVTPQNIAKLAAAMFWMAIATVESGKAGDELRLETIRWIFADSFLVEEERYRVPMRRVPFTFDFCAECESEDPDLWREKVKAFLTKREALSKTLEMPHGTTYPQ